MPRPVWSGTISFGLIAIPIKLFHAVQPQERVVQPARRAHDEPHPLPQGVRRDRRGGARRAHRQGLRGLQGSLRHRRPRRARAVHPGGHQDRSSSRSSSISTEIDPVYFESAYYVAPDANPKPYVLLARAMEEAGKVAIGRFVMRNKQYTAAIRADRRPADDVDAGLRRRGRRRRTRSTSWPASTTSTSSDREVQDGRGARRVADATSSTRRSTTTTTASRCST